MVIALPPDVDHDVGLRGADAMLHRRVKLR